MAEITNEEGWVTISADSGTGNTEITATINEVNTGRDTRTAVLVGETDHGAEATANIMQAGKPEFVEFDASPANYNIANDATYVTLTGKSNSRKLTFSLPEKAEIPNQQDFLVVPETYTATKGLDSQTVDNGANLNPDYGESGEYHFSITLTLKDTTPSNTRTEYVKVTTYGGISTMASVTQAGIATTILFDGDSTHTYNVSTLDVGDTQTIHLGVTPNNEHWTLAFDE